MLLKLIPPKAVSAEDFENRIFFPEQFSMQRFHCCERNFSISGIINWSTGTFLQDPLLNIKLKQFCQELARRGKEEGVGQDDLLGSLPALTLL